MIQTLFYGVLSFVLGGLGNSSFEGQSFEHPNVSMENFSLFLLQVYLHGSPCQCVKNSYIWGYMQSEFKYNYELFMQLKKKITFPVINPSSPCP